MKLNYKGKEYELKYSFRGMMIYENITNKSFAPNGLSDIIIFFYSCLLGATKGQEVIKYDDFIDWLDENPIELENFSNWLIEIMKQQHALLQQKDDDKPQETENLQETKN